MRELHLFAGSGGGILGGMLLGHTTVCAVEIQKYNQEILKARQLDGHLPEFPIYDDVCTFDGKEWLGKVDIVCGGFPCQDVSQAGVRKERKGIDGERSGLVYQMLRIIDECKPRIVFAENSPMLRTRGLDTVVHELTKMGYDCAWGVIGANAVNAPHKRERMWLVAYSPVLGLYSEEDKQELEGKGKNQLLIGKPGDNWNQWGENTPRIPRVDDGSSRRVDRIKTIGNAQVPQVAALAFQTLIGKLINEAK